MGARPVAGAVLAGGRSRRMGRPKAAVEVDGRAMVLRVLDALRLAGCHPLVVVGGDPSVLAPLGVEPVPDRWPGEGPVGGVITALELLGGDAVVASCDLPDLDAAAVGEVVAGGDGDVDVAVAATDRAQPSLARWNRSGLPALVAAFGAGERSMLGAIGALRSVEVPVEGRALRNANRPGDLVERDRDHDAR